MILVSLASICCQLDHSPRFPFPSVPSLGRSNESILSAPLGAPLASRSRHNEVAISLSSGRSSPALASRGRDVDPHLSTNFKLLQLGFSLSRLGYDRQGRQLRVRDSASAALGWNHQSFCVTCPFYSMSCVLSCKIVGNCGSWPSPSSSDVSPALEFP